MGINATNPQGHLIAHLRWVNLYLNGLYWGAYQLTERVDSDFLEAYVFEDRDYDIRTNEGVKEGDAVAWNDLLARCNAAKSTPANNALYDAVADLLDMDNYIDYMIVNLFMRNADWGNNNFRTVRRRPSPNEIDEGTEVDDRWKCLTWDMDHSMQAGFQSEVKLKGGAGQPAYPLLSPGIPDPYLLLIDHPRFEADFQARVAVHFGTGGALGPEVAAATRGRTFSRRSPTSSMASGQANRHGGGTAASRASTTAMTIPPSPEAPVATGSAASPTGSRPGSQSDASISSALFTPRALRIQPIIPTFP